MKNFPTKYKLIKVNSFSIEQYKIKSIGGPDASFSLDEYEFSLMVNAVRDAEVALGNVDYTLTQKQQAGKAFSRSLYVVKDVRKGQELTEENIKSIRPGYGMHPKYYNQVIGKKFNKDVKAGERLRFKLIE